MAIVDINYDLIFDEEAKRAIIRLEKMIKRQNEVFNERIGKLEDRVMNINCKAYKNRPIKTKVDRMLHIIERVCLYCKVQVSDLDEKRISRDSEVVGVRQLCHYFGYKFSGLTLEKVGKMVGSKDHATVMNSIKVIKRKPKEFLKEVEEFILEK